MPALSPEDRITLLGYMKRSCTCGARIYKNYCRQCDEFFLQCKEGCVQHDKTHDGHRIYPREERNSGEPEGTLVDMPGLVGMMVDTHSKAPDIADQSTVDAFLASALTPSERGYSLRAIFYALYNLGRERGKKDNETR